MTRHERFDEAVPYLEEFVRNAPPDRYRSDVSKVKLLVAKLRRRN